MNEQYTLSREAMIEQIREIMMNKSFSDRQQEIDEFKTADSEGKIRNKERSLLLRSQLNARISLSFKRNFENDQSKLRILVDSCLENQRTWLFVLNSTIPVVLV